MWGIGVVSMESRCGRKGVEKEIRGGVWRQGTFSPETQQPQSESPPGNHEHQGVCVCVCVFGTGRECVCVVGISVYFFPLAPTAAVQLKEDEALRQSSVSVMFSYNGRTCASSTHTLPIAVSQGNGGAAGAQVGKEKTLKAVFEEMDVMQRLNNPGSSTDLELKWKDPEDQQDIVWRIIESDNVNMSFFSRLTRVNIQVVKN
jgi:hypothetical protein